MGVPLVSGWEACVTFAFSSATGRVPLQSPRGSPAKLSITWTLWELICLHARSSSLIELLIPWRGRRDNIQQLVISSFPSVPHTECQFKKKNCRELAISKENSLGKRRNKNAINYLSPCPGVWVQSIFKVIENFRWEKGSCSWQIASVGGRGGGRRREKAERGEKERLISLLSEKCVWDRQMGCKYSEPRTGAETRERLVIEVWLWWKECIS